MKISKLFHWLYAILMLLPFLVFLPNAFYYGFNEHAVAQEKTEQMPIYYESNEVTQATDIYINNIYFYKNNFVNTYQGVEKNLFYLNIDLFLKQYPQYSVHNPTRVTMNLRTSGIALYVAWFNSNNQSTGEVVEISSRQMYFVPIQRNNDNLINDYVIDYIEETNIKYIKEYQPLTTSMSITDSMSYAWDSVWQNDLFSWSYGSFLTEPFIYIGNIFNVPVDNSLYYALSYWLDISIIWLCFDMVMYIPLLVHRWLDKGIIE